MMGFCDTSIQCFDFVQFQEKLASVQGKRVVFFLSESGEKRWNLCNCANDLGKNNFVCRINQTYENPTIYDIVQVLSSIGNFGEIDTIIAIGGGSTIDMAKAVRSFYRFPISLTEKELRNQLQNKQIEVYNGNVDLIAIPTTAGTGSELTSWATIWDFKTLTKYSLDSEKLKPTEAWIVSELTYSLSATLQLSTGLDALCHAVEAFWSVHTSPVVQEISYRAIDLILNNLHDATNKGDILLKERMCQASVLSALAFSQTRTTACHSISYPLTMLHHIPHGYAVAITLPDVLELNKGSYKNSELLMQLFKQQGGVHDWLRAVCEDTIELSLRTWGVKEKDIKNIAEKSFTLGRVDNNPVSLTQCDVEKILQRHL